MLSVNTKLYTPLWEVSRLKRRTHWVVFHLISNKVEISLFTVTTRFFKANKEEAKKIIMRDCGITNCIAIEKFNFKNNKDIDKT